ncbi:MAG TPA: hypothetical protein VMO47_10515 [Rhodothermales bacterium]|nr:hypothetical protein [Rhodothermales bacterium]
MSKKSDLEDLANLAEILEEMETIDRLLASRKEHGITHELLRRVSKGEKKATKQFNDFLEVMGYDNG